MQYAKSDLENLVPLWERELAYPIHQSVSGGFLRGDVNVFSSSIRQNGIGNLGALAQDIFGAEVVRQGAVQRTLK